MKLSEINNKTLNDDKIQNIVYSKIEDDGLSSKYGLVFGNSMLIKERTLMAVKIYKEKRVNKLIFMGGQQGISNQANSNISEADRMKELAISLGVLKNDILIDNKSNNTFENINNALEIIGEEIKSIKNIVIVTSEFHLKRCLGILKKKLPNINVSLVGVKDGKTDSENWFLSDNSWNTGRSIVTYEANLLIKYAKEGKIVDFDINSI